MVDRAPPPTRFRFKSQQRRHEGPSNKDATEFPRRSRSPPSRSHSRSGQRHRRRHHHRSHNRSTDSHEDSRSVSPLRPRSVSPDTAFRESLFDALADDEGAAYWEGVYGQPVHTYSRYRPSSEQDEDGNPTMDAEGNYVLERMTDEEYTSYVRQRMWERSHGHILQARQRRQRAREQDRADTKAREAACKESEERRAWDDRLQNSLRRRRDDEREGKEAKRSWERYTAAWERMEAARRGRVEMQPTSTNAAEKKKLKLTMPWPTVSGLSNDICQETVESFYRRHVSTATTTTYPRHTKSTGVLDLLPIIKSERVRWHPDKIQQRYGSLCIEDMSLERVTAVFQILDRFWLNLKDSNNGNA